MTAPFYHALLGGAQFRMALTGKSPVVHGWRRRRFPRTYLDPTLVCGFQHSLRYFIRCLPRTFGKTSIDRIGRNFRGC